MTFSRLFSFICFLFLGASSAFGLVSEFLNELEVKVSDEKANAYISRYRRLITAYPKKFDFYEKYVVANFSLALNAMDAKDFAKVRDHSFHGIYAAKQALTLRTKSPKIYMLMGSLKCLLAAVYQNSFVRVKMLLECGRDLDKGVTFAEENSKAEWARGGAQYFIARLLRGLNSGALPKNIKRAAVGRKDLDHILQMKLSVFFELLPTLEKQRVFYNLALLHKKLSNFKTANILIDDVLNLDNTTDNAKKALKLREKL